MTYMRKLAVGGILAFGVLLLFVAIMRSNYGPESVAVHASPAATQPCTANDFTLSKTKATREYETATLTGIIKSNCASAVGVQLKWTAFNSDGTVAFSSDFWPASTTNIPPHSDYAFEMMEAAPRGKWTYQVEPVSVNVW